MKHRVLVLGYFGYLDNQLDGQTIKTRNVYSLLKAKEGEAGINVQYFDTQMFKESKLNLVKMLFEIYRCQVLVYIGAQDNLRFLFPLIYIFSKLSRVKVHYLVVGGWLAQFIDRKPIHIFFLKRIDGIYPETTDLCNELRKRYRFRNVHRLNNFRTANETSKLVFNKDKNTDEIKLVFMGRVHPKKGIGVLFALAENLKENGFSHVSIHVYGPIYDAYKLEFETKILELDNVEYRGVVQQKDISSVLRCYDLMLFPTQFFTEGFPGSILDSYFSGIPVVASKWKYAAEFIEDNVGGVISKFGDDEDFISKVLELVTDSEKLNSLKKGVLNQALKYGPDSAWAVLKNGFFLSGINFKS